MLFFGCLSREGHEKVVSLLLENSADVELPDNYGQSPLFMACWKGEFVVQYLQYSYRFGKIVENATNVG